MEFNEYQERLWRSMIKTIKDFENGLISYRDFLSGLGAPMDVGEFKDEEVVRKWYELTFPLEEFWAWKGNETRFTDVEKFLIEMKSFLNEVLHKSTTN